MAQAGYTPIQLYYSTTTSNVPSAGNLASGELAINITDGKLFYKDNGGSVQVIAWKTTPTTAGGTGLTSWTAGDLPYYATGTTLSKLGIGTNGQVLTSTGTAPQWSTLSGVAVTTFSAGTTGFTPSSATSGAVTLAGTLATTNGGTGLTSFTANGVVYASSSSALTTGSALTFNGSDFGVSASIATATLASSGAYSALSFTNSGGASSSGLVLVNSSGIMQTRAATQQWTNADASSEYMRLTSTGLGIGTSSFTSKLTVDNTGASTPVILGKSGDQSGARIALQNTGTGGQTWQLVAGDVGVSNSGLSFYDATNAATRMRLDSSGNLGLGVTPSAWGGNKAVQVNARTSLYSSADGGAVVGNNLYYNGTNNIYIASNYATAYQQNAAGQHIWYNAPSGTAGNAISFTQAMILDASGTLGLGVTPSAWGSVYKALQLTDGAAFAEGGGNTYVGNNWYNNGSSGIYIANGAAAVYGQSNGQHQWFNAPSGTAGNIATFTQAMTLDAPVTPRLLIGTTTAGVGGNNNTNLTVAGGATVYQSLIASGSQEIYLFAQSGLVGLFARSNDPMLFGTNNTERARITSVGNFSLGTHADRGTTVGTNAIQIFNGTAPAGTLTNGVSLYSSSGDLNFMNSAGNGFKVGYRNLPPVGTQTGSYTLAAGDVGKYVQVSTGGSITIPTSVFAEGDAISIYNNTTGNITITCSAPTAYIAGTNTVKTSMTLATRGVATVLFYSATACVVSGNVT